MQTDLLNIATTLQERFGTSLQDFRDQAILVVPADKLYEAARTLRDEFGFRMLSDETAVDYGPQVEPRFHVVCQLRDLSRNLLVTLRTPLPGAAPHLASLTSLFPGAIWMEREIWDMFGITFDDHPDPRRIIMPYDWQGHPLRKDYPLGYEEVQFTFNEKEIMLRKLHPKG